MHALRPLLRIDATGLPKRPSRARGAVIGLALLNLLIFASTACGEDTPDEGLLRGRGPLVSDYDAITACEAAVYQGTDTPLYSNRPYHTAQPVRAAQGLGFCRGARHGTNVWILEVTRSTTLVAFGNAAFGLEGRGWTRSDEAVLVAAAGVPLDRIYTRRVEPGRYVIRQGFTRAAPIVLWDTAAAQPAP